MSHPYERLDPERVLGAVQAAGLHPDGRLLALNSYENRVYQVGVEDETLLGGQVVLKFYRPARWSDAAILEEHAFAQALVEAEIPVVAPLRVAGRSLLRSEEFRFALFPRRGGRAPELEMPGVLRRIGYFLGRLHVVGAREPFCYRSSLNPGIAREARDRLLSLPILPEHWQASYRAASETLLAAIEAAFARVGELRSIRLHGDTHIGNILWTEAGPHFVDLDDACNGPAVQDLWMLLSGDAGEMRQQLDELLAGYEAFCSFDRRELQLIEALRAIRLIRFAAWIAERWDDPAFPAAFSWFGDERYWPQHVSDLRDQALRISAAM